MQPLIKVANSSHTKYAIIICNMMEEAAKVRGTGIAKRTPEYITQKIIEGKSIVAFDGETLIGFCYIESWQGEKYVANSGLITHPNYRSLGLGKQIKSAAFKLSKQKFPNSKLFGITTSLAVMKINSELGYKPVTFSELTDDEKFWNGCKSCSNYDVLLRANKKMCFCTGMICDLSKVNQHNKKIKWHVFKDFLEKKKLKMKEKTNKLYKLGKIANNEK